MVFSADALGLETKTLQLKGHVFTMLAAFAGVVLGVLGSMGFVSNMLQSQFAAQNAQLGKQLVSVSPASDVNACAVPSSSSASAGGRGGDEAVATAGPSGASSETGGKGADQGGGGNGGGRGADVPFVNQMISGSLTNTGPDSTNTINASNNFSYKEVNNSDVKVTNDNHQRASSGDATVSGNANGGSAGSGQASNQNSSSTSVSIEN